MTFADSGYGSISLTPPTRNRGAPNRVTKRAKKPAMKDTAKTVEATIPGFQIMTKDGVDVTSSAGRGTKTKEQREHAHLMRIMKACDGCKRKKVRVSFSKSLQSWLESALAGFLNDHPGSTTSNDHQHLRTLKDEERANCDS
jgi:hypothetical protein